MAVEFGLKLGAAGEGYDHKAGIINLDRMRTERATKAQAAMKQNGLTACLLFRPENIRYVTSTTHSNFIERLRYALAFAEHEPLLFEPFGNPRGECYWVKPENRRLSLHWASQSPGPQATLDVTRRFAASIKHELQQKGLEKEKLGVDDLDEPSRQALTEAGIEVVNAMPTMLEARAVKTADEINCMHMAAVLSDTAHFAMYQAIKPGIREREIVAIGNDALYRAGAENVFCIIVCSGGQIGGRSMNSDKIVQVGDVITIDIVRATYLGYNTCCYRNYVVGRKPTDKEKDLHRKSYERVYKVLDAIKPGITTADAAKHWVTAKEKGLPSEEYLWCEDLGHGLGLWLYEYPIINRLWSLEYPQVIEKGMVIAVEARETDPMIGATKLEEMVVVTDNGVEVLTRMPIKDMMIASSITTAE